MTRHLAHAAGFVFLVVTSAAVVQPQGVAPDRGDDLVARFLEPEEHPLVSYRARRRLVASTRGGKMHASLEAKTTLDPVRGFIFEVIVEEGSAMIRKRVLHGALDAEQRAVNSDDRYD